MKKTLIAFAAAAALTTSAFAEITFGAWGRGVLVPVASNGDGTQAFQTTSWGGVPRVGIDVIGSSENVGFQFGLHGDDGAVGIHDNAKIWVQPFDFLKVTGGLIQNNTLRGDWCFGSWNWLRPSWINDEGITFSNFQDTGMQVELFPVEGLYVAVGVPLKKNNWGGEGDFNIYGAGKDGDKYDGDAGETYRASVVQAAYTIAGAGQIKAAYRGSNELVGNDGDKKYKKGVIEAAFASRGDNALVENLGFEVGVAYDLTSKDDGGAATKIAMGVSYTGIEKLGLNANAAVFLPKDTDENETTGHKNKTYVQAGVGVDYAVADGVTLNADCRIETSKASEKDPEKDDDPTKIGFLIGAAKGFSNGKIGAGFQATTKGGFAGSLVGKDEGKAKDKMTWAVPVVLEYWF